MTQRFSVHPTHPQVRLIGRTVAILRSGGLIAYPTDSSYALGCCLDDKPAQERIRRIRRLGPEHDFTLVCRDLSEVATYARIDNASFRLMRACTPGAFTFILKASREVPRRLQNPKRRTIGLRVPDHPIAHALLDSLGEPLMSSTLQMPDDELPLAEPDDIESALGGQIDALLDGGNCGIEPTTVLDLTGAVPVVLREGRGDVSLAIS